MKEKFTNHLINETSAYLLQHAHNPVNWYPWGEQALKKAKNENKPILVSIGYSACHWCHVMERESFENEQTAAIMNKNFINIKIDREERPDLDHIYMDAVQTITGSGGWPLNVFLTPDLKPFYGGTYFPPVTAFNRSSWTQVINAVAISFQSKKNEIEQQAQGLTDHLLKMNDFLSANSEEKSLGWNDTLLKNIAGNLLKTADTSWGGFGNAPKFPQTFSILYLLRHYYFFGEEPALQQATLSLDKMMMGGIYDHIGGGFARYSTDKHWQIPHFEKMLYDNALLLDAFTEAYQLTKKKEYANVIKQTINFINNEMTSPEGGFYSAFDADSEGEEGKYYTWSKKEIDDLLGNDSKVFCGIYNITEKGNWDGTNILWITENLQTATEKFNLKEEDVFKLLERSKDILLESRKKRISPLLDTKVLLSWNALMIKSLCKAYSAFDNELYLEMAKNNLSFIETNFQNLNGTCHHSWNKVLNKQEAFLDDYAALIQAYIFMYQDETKDEYLFKARQLAERVIKDFSDEDNIFFYYTPTYQTDVIIRKKEMYDGATPSGNALMIENLLILSIYFDIGDWKSRAEKALEVIKSTAAKHPVSFSYWSLNLQAFIKGYREIVITGVDYLTALKEIWKEYIPVRVIQASAEEKNYWHLLQGKIFSNRTLIYLCENYNCLKPVATIEDFKLQVNQNFFNKKAPATK